MLPPPLARPTPLAIRRPLFRRPTPSEARVYAVLHDVARAEHENAPRRDRNFLPGLRIAAHPLALLADVERSERGQLDGLTPGQALREHLDHQLDQLLGLVAWQSDFLDHRLREVRARERLATHGFWPLPYYNSKDASFSPPKGQQQQTEIAHITCLPCGFTSAQAPRPM